MNEADKSFDEYDRTLIELLRMQEELRKAAKVAGQKARVPELKASLAARHKARYEGPRYLGVEPNLLKRNLTHCYQCKGQLDPSDAVCQKCNGYICLECAVCGCGYSGWVDPRKLLG